MSDWPRAAVWPLRGGPPRIGLDRSIGPLEDPAVEAEWARMCAQNPRLYDGPILSVHEWDEGAGKVRCRVLGFRHLAVRARVPNPAEQLSILGITLCAGADGREHVLLGRRGAGVRIYGGMWELAPAGGIEVPGEGVEEITTAALLEQLALEFREEVSPHFEEGAARAGESAAREASIVALVRDPLAFSLDLAAVILLPMGPERAAPLRTPASASAWEYSELMWLPRDEAAGFEAREGGRIIPTTRSLLRVLGWVPMR